MRKQYKELLKKYHPDNPNGSTEATQEINAEYDRLFKVLKERHASADSENRKADFNKKYYDFAEDKALREMLNKIIGFSNVTIEICGSWLWVFNSYDYRNELKEIGFKYAPKKKHGTGTVKHLRKKENALCQWMILEAITAVQKLKQRKPRD